MTATTNTTEMGCRKSFVFFTSWAAVLKKHPMELRCQIYDAIIDYAENGVIPQLNDVAQMAFDFIKSELDRTQNSYKNKCERNKENIRKRWEKLKKQNTTVYDRIQSYKPNTNDTYNEDENKDDDEDKDEDVVTHPLKCVCDKSYIARTDGSALLDRFFSPGQTAQVEQLAMALATTPDRLRALAEEVVNDWQLSETTHADYRDASTHLMSAIRRKLDYQRTHPTPGQQQPDPADDPTLSERNRKRLAHIKELLAEHAPTFMAATTPMTLPELRSLAKAATSRGLSEYHLIRAMQEVENKVAAAANAGKPCPYGKQGVTLLNFIEKLKP